MKSSRTPTINGYLKDANCPKISESDIGESWIEYRAAIAVGKASGIPLYQFFKGTSVWIPPKEDASQRPKTAEYVQSMEKSRRDESERQYRELSGSSNSGSPMNISEITREVNSQLTTIVNVLVSIFAVAWAFWYWCSSWSSPMRTSMSSFSGMFVGVAEVVVFSGYQRRSNEARARKLPQEERKIIKQTVFTRGNVSEVVSEKSVIAESQKSSDTGLRNRSEKIKI